MVCEASSSNPNLAFESKAAAAAAAPPPSSSSSSSILAPGFRFHPTDEELVSYYLKRKVKGLPLRVDAIAELDLYKKEPWELPSLSRLRTGDKEWYFFVALDRKNANRCRTNRSTDKGYWKTTGKDRPVRHFSRVVGMKKTLVFHEGRAPRGKRTNWVMHEYRLEDGNLSADLLQGSFVVCRIFEKCGSGPQNGAQYGAPFVEEEWETAEAVAPADTFMDISGDQEFVKPEDYEQKQILGDQHENTANVVAESVGRDGGSYFDGPALLLEELLDLCAYTDEPRVQDGANTFLNTQENSAIQDQSCSPSDQNDEYLELKDIFDMDNSDISFDGLHAMDYGHITENVVYDSATLPEVQGTDLLFNIPDGTVTAEEATQICSPTDGYPHLQSENFLTPVAGEYASVQLPEDNNLFYDALSNEPQYADDGFLNTDDILFSPTADLPELDMVDELMAYFDATDNHLRFDILDSVDNSEYVSPVDAALNSVPKVEGNSSFMEKATLQVPGTNVWRNASSPAGFVSSIKQSESLIEDYTVARDIQANNGWNNSLKKRVVNMLGSISAPPAMAAGSAKGKAVELLSTSSPIRVSTGMIHVVMDAQPWARPKNGDGSFYLSYGLAPYNTVRKSTCYEPVSKMQNGVFTMLLRGGMYIFGLSVLFLSVSLKVGLCVRNK